MRLKPRIPTEAVIKCILAMFTARLGSLNALEQTNKSKTWKRWLGADLPSADTIGAVAARTDVDSVRKCLHGVYSQIKRNKALSAKCGGLNALVIDGHETSASYKRCCAECRQRIIKTCNGDHVQYYHQYVCAMLIGRDFPIFVDIEPIRPGENEKSAALRLLKRCIKDYPRAFDVVLGDAMYADAKIANLLLKHKKHLLAVLKANNPNLLEDAQALCASQAPTDLATDASKLEAWQAWDQEGFTTWPKVQGLVRVVRSRETRKIRRQRTGEFEEESSDWMWVTTLSSNVASTRTVIRLGHARWDIENLGFNETVNRWKADHVYKHHPNAILVFQLLAMMAFNLFQVFYFRNLKIQVRQCYSRLHVARQAAAEIYAEILLADARAP